MNTWSLNLCPKCRIDLVFHKLVDETNAWDCEYAKKEFERLNSPDSD